MAEISIIDGVAEPGVIASNIADFLRAALDAGDEPVAISVPGGSTPFPIMEELVKHDLDWSRVVVWPGDDRVVEEDHPASNRGKIRSLFEPAGAQVAALNPMEEVPHFALVWLGMGADGHIASLFPNTDPQLDVDSSIVQLTPDPLPPEAPFDRVSLTLPALLNSDRIMFTLGGSADKHEVFEAALKGEHDLPIARLLGAASQPVTCYN